MNTTEIKHDILTTTMGEKDVMEKVKNNCGDLVAFDLYRKKYQELIDNPFESAMQYPIQLDIEVNGTCNYKCPSCNYRMDRAIKRPYLSLDKYREIITEGIDSGELRAIRLNYHNEPLLKTDIDEYIRIAKEKGILDVFLSTNGSLLDENMSVRLIEAGIDRIQVSIDAISRDSYEAIRPGGKYETVEKNILNFIDIRNRMEKEIPTIRVNFVRQPKNEKELGDFIDFWKEKGVDSIGIQDYVDWCVPDTDEFDMNEYQCLLPYRLMVIRHNGDVLPCCMFDSTELVIGNIYESSLSEIWNSKRMKEIRNLSLESFGWKNNPVCKKCVRSIFSGKKKTG